MKRSDTKVAVEFCDEGQGEPALLCLPGWCAERSVFEDLEASCCRTRRTLSLNWRGHGGSDAAPSDFGHADLLEDALGVIEAAGVSEVVPVALAHSGWTAIELRRRLPERVPAIVLIDWLALDPPPPFLAALARFQDAQSWEAAREQLFSMWLQGVESSKVHQFVRGVMGAYGFEMWSRAGREIGNAYRREGSPLKALERLVPSVPVLHLYAQPEDESFFQAQRTFAQRNPWFQVQRLAAKSHFPMLEYPEDMAKAIEAFLSSQ